MDQRRVARGSRRPPALSPGSRTPDRGHRRRVRHRHSGDEIARSSASSRRMSGSGSVSSSRRMTISCCLTNASASSAIAARAQRFQVSDRESSAQRIERGQLPPPRDGRIAISRRIRGQRQERRRHRTRQAAPLLLHPSLEPRCAWQVEPVEERSPRERDGLLAISGSDGRAKLADVRRHRGRIEVEVRSVRLDDVPAQLVSQRVQHLSRRMSRVFFVRVGPEQCGEAFARDARVRPLPRARRASPGADA